MRTINLRSIVEVFEHYKSKTSEVKFLKIWDKEIKFIDLETLKSLLERFYQIDQEIDINIFNDFHISYSIPQIGKEFDLLRITEKNILNIELKSEFTSKIKNQLLKNRYYLKFLT